MKARGLWLAIGGALAIALLGAWFVRDRQSHAPEETLVAKPVALPPISRASLAAASPCSNGGTRASAA
jgi:hypothetical protein